MIYRKPFGLILVLLNLFSCPAAQIRTVDIEPEVKRSRTNFVDSFMTPEVLSTLANVNAKSVNNFGPASCIVACTSSILSCNLFYISGSDCFYGQMESPWTKTTSEGAFGALPVKIKTGIDEKDLMKANYIAVDAGGGFTWFNELRDGYVTYANAPIWSNNYLPHQYFAFDFGLDNGYKFIEITLQIAFTDTQYKYFNDMEATVGNTMVDGNTRSTNPLCDALVGEPPNFKHYTFFCTETGLQGQYVILQNIGAQHAITLYEASFLSLP